jgi:hypothetical protein
VTLTLFQVQLEQLLLPHKMQMSVALERTDAAPPDTVRSVIGTPVVGVPVGLLFL